MTLATFMEVLDTSIANVALQHIAGGLSAGQDESTWVLTGYLISNAIVLPMSGWLTTVIGRKRFYIICVALFAASSILCGFAPAGWIVRESRRYYRRRLSLGANLVELQYGFWRRDRLPAFEEPFHHRSRDGYRSPGSESGDIHHQLFLRYLRDHWHHYGYLVGRNGTIFSYVVTGAYVD